MIGPGDEACPDCRYPHGRGWRLLGMWTSLLACSPPYGRDLMTAVDATREPVRVAAQASLSVLSRPDCTIASLEGELDIATVPELRERLLGLLGPGVRLLIIDLSGMSFCDVAGLAVLIGTQRRATARGIVVRLAAPRPQVLKLLRITGLDRSFTICATLDDALPAQSGGPTATTSLPPAQARPATRGT